MLIPINRYLTVEPLEEVQTQSGVLVPDGVELNKQPYKVATVLEASKNSEIQKGFRVVVPTHMIEEVSFFGKTYYLVLENHVVGYIEESVD